MKFQFIDEPELEFGSNKHVCPRAGITGYGVYDTRLTDRRENIFVGAVGTNETLDKLGEWLNRCSEYISAKPDAAQPNLFPAFCGFNLDTGFRARFEYGTRILRPLKNSVIENILKIEDWNKRVEQAVDMYFEQIKFLAQNRAVDVIVCIVPDALYDNISKEKDVRLEEILDERPVNEDFVGEEDEADDALETNFRRALKAKTMQFAVPLQLVREISFEPIVKEQQDEATKAWNFCTALYYKSSRQTIPWKLIIDPNKPDVWTHLKK
jgi:hypothetical protein